MLRLKTASIAVLEGNGVYDSLQSKLAIAVSLQFDVES